MGSRVALVWLTATLCLLAYFASTSSDACCPAMRRGEQVVNADQTVIIIWDPVEKVQHFIRQASFKGDADDFGFLVPSPSQPELSESGNEAFPYLMKLTEPEIKTMKRSTGGGGCGLACSDAPEVASKSAPDAKSVTVLDQKRVAGFDAVVLETKSSEALVKWLKDHGYAFSPEIEAWAKPYVEKDWKITALKVAKKDDKGAKEEKNGKDHKSVSAAALRMSFKTERPLFPYREPDYKSAADSLNPNGRLLRIYFLADGRYEGELTKDQKWTGTVAWAGKLDAEQRKKMLEHLKLPEKTGPAEWWLTEFEDRWPYKVAPADVYFGRDANQNSVRREPIVRYVSAPFPTDVGSYAIVAVIFLPAIWLRIRCWWDE